jgi:hypothetical protein
MLCVITNPIMLSVVMLNVVMPNVVMLSVVAQFLLTRLIKIIKKICVLLILPKP